MQTEIQSTGQTPPHYETVWIRQIELNAQITDENTLTDTVPHTVLAVTTLSSEQMQMAQVQDPDIGPLLLMK